ncbi:MAG: DUF4296 domain-containing protein [Flavobacterium sp.]|nr:MAG: DUF4296 domain-containing protein [Flavobacterium sp.]
MKQACFLLLILLAACGKPVVEKPANLIAEETMVDILYDLSLLDAMKSQSPQKLQLAKDADTYVYKKYKIDSLQFANSSKYYASDLKEFRKIYDKVNDRLAAENLKAEDQAKTPNAKKKLPDEGLVK